jgi:DNA-directed RNA polymerase subunit RPC12/RpoP
VEAERLFWISVSWPIAFAAHLAVLGIVGLANAEGRPFDVFMWAALAFAAGIGFVVQGVSLLTIGVLRWLGGMTEPSSVIKPLVMVGALPLGFLPVVLIWAGFLLDAQLFRGMTDVPMLAGLCVWTSPLVCLGLAVGTITRSNEVSLLCDVCGYDYWPSCSASGSDRCPECGAKVFVVRLEPAEAASDASLEGR